MMQEVAAVVPQVVTVTDRQRQHIQLTELAVPQVVLVAAQAAVQGANKLEVVVLELVHLVGRLGKEMATKVMVVHGGVRLVVEHHVETITLVLAQPVPSRPPIWSASCKSWQPTPPIRAIRKMPFACFAVRCPNYMRDWTLFRGPRFRSPCQAS
jgi:hypothetical protein